MKSTDFNLMLQKFFTVYLPADKDVSKETISSYRTTFSLFLKFIRDKKGMPAGTLTLKDFSRHLVEDFLRELKESRNNTSATRNIRLAAIVSFVNFLFYEYPDYSNEYEKIKRIVISKDYRFKPLKFLTAEGLALYIDVITKDKKYGARNFVIISTLTTMALRASEVVALKVENIHLGTPSYMNVYGKGAKTRQIPIPSLLENELKTYMTKHHLDDPLKRNNLLFVNNKGEPFTRFGIFKMVRKYAAIAHQINPDLVPANLSPHGLRHSAAILYLNQKIDLIYIRDLLGHSSVATTQIYLAGNNPSNRKEAIEKGVKEILGEKSVQTYQEQELTEDLIEWLEKLGKKK